MWVKLLRAEWYKVAGNRWVVGCLIWIFPILAVLASSIAIVIAVFSTSMREGLVAEPLAWTDAALFPWAIPTNGLGVLLLLGFTAVVFAGEYQWETWKTIVPHSQRVALILAKFFTVAAFIIFAFTIMSILMVIGMGLLSLVAGSDYGPALNDDAAMRDFVENYAYQMLSAFLFTLIAAGTASLAAMLTRSILGSVIISIFFTIGQTLMAFPLSILSELLKTDAIQHIYRFVPGYQIINLSNRLQGYTPEGLELQSGEVVVDSLLFTEAVVVGWAVGLIALTAYLFQRQDITH